MRLNALPALANGVRTPDRIQPPGALTRPPWRPIRTRARSFPGELLQHLPCLGLAPGVERAARGRQAQRLLQLEPRLVVALLVLEHAGVGEVVVHEPGLQLDGLANRSLGILERRAPEIGR